jgi:hypothetical protein
MKTFLHLIATFFVSTLALWGTLGKGNPWPCYGVVLAAWALFFWRYHCRLKREASRKHFEQAMFREYMRAQPRSRYR